MGENDRKQKSIRRAALAVAMITNFTSPFSATALNIAVPHIGAEFHASATSLSWIVLSFLMVTALLAIPFGRIADIRGRKNILRLGILLICVASFLNIFSPNMPVFYLFRVIQGVGAAMIFATNTAILVSAFPAERRGSVLGISVAAVFVGSASGPVIGGLITHTFGWRAIFIAISAFALIAFIMAMTRLPKENKPVTKAKINYSSIVFYTLSLGLLLCGLVTLSQNIWSYLILGAGIALIILFVRREARTEAPLIEVRLFSKNLDFSLANLAALFIFAAVFAVVYLMSLYLQLARGFTADVSGIILISQPVVQIVLSPIAGRLSDKRSPAAIATIGMACCAGALFMFAFMGGQTPLAYILAALLLTGFGVGLFSSPNANVVLGSVSKKDYSVATSVQSTARTVGQVFGMAVLTIIMNAVIGNVQIDHVAPTAIIRDTHISFLAFAAVCIVGIFISLRRRKDAGDGEAGL